MIELSHEYMYMYMYCMQYSSELIVVTVNHGVCVFNCGCIHSTNVQLDALR